MTRRMATMVLGGAMLLVLAILGTQLSVPYVVLSPGPTVDTLGTDTGGTEIIKVKGKQQRRTDGHLNLTTVSVRNRLGLFSAFSAWVSRRSSVVPREEIYPPGKTEQQVDQETTQQFTDSQGAAEFAALGELGYPQAMVIVSLPDGSPSAGKLAAKDVLTSIDRKPVGSYDEVSKLLSAIEPGATVTVGYTRGGKPGTAEIVTTKSSDRKGAALGVVLSLRRTAPFEVTIALDEAIGGPSAGLMFALGIIEKVGPEELTGGRFIAGTGTIQHDGQVGPIGGIQLKMIGARDKGATVFLVPDKNCTDALARPPAGLQLVRVATLHSAVEALRAIKAGRSAPTC